MFRNIIFLILFVMLTPCKSFSSQFLNFSEMKMLSQHSTSEKAYDEAINIAPNFGISQIDSGLSSYFDSKTLESYLCGPASLAHFLIYQMGITHTLPISRKVPGVSRNLKSIDANDLIKDLAKICKTDRSRGTSDYDLMNCIDKAFEVYFGKSVTIDRVENTYGMNPYSHNSVQVYDHAPELTDIKDALRNGDPVLAEIDWLEPIANTEKWRSNSGHFVMIYGYAWESYFQENLLQLDVMDPMYNWTTSKDFSVFNSVMAIRRKDAPNFRFFLEGRGFEGQGARGFLQSLSIIHINH